jgi:hypothetical protein
MNLPKTLARRLPLASCALALTVLSGCLGPPGGTVEEQRSNAMKMRDETLAELYTREPGIKPVLEKAAGYVVMKGGSLHLGLISLASTYVVIVDNSTGKPVHDCFFRFGVGPGIAAKSFRGAYIIDDKEGLQKVLDAPWVLGLLVEASFRFGSFGGSLADAYAFNHGAHGYYWTENGFALEAALGIGKLWHDGDLKDPPKDAPKK